MTQKRSKRLQVVIDLALAAETQAARNLSEAQNELESERQRLRDIETYYQNYQDQFARKTENLRSTELSNSRAFLSNLDQACQAQAFQLKHSEEKVAVARQQWRKSHLKSDALESFQARVANDEQALADKNEQKYIDDLINQRRP